MPKDTVDQTYINHGKIVHRLYVPRERGRTYYDFYRPIRSVPVIGPWLGRVGKVMDILATPCSPSPMIWVQAFFSALPRLLYTFDKPFLIADQFHGRRPGGRNKKKGTIGIIDESLPEIEDLDSPLWRGFVILAEFILKAEWYLFIIDRTTEFLLNWTSLAYAYAGCNEPYDRGQRFNADVPIQGIGLTGANYVETGTSQSWGGAPVPTFVVHFEAGYSGAIHAMGHFAPYEDSYHHPCQNVEIVVRHIETNEDYHLGYIIPGRAANYFTGMIELTQTFLGGGSYALVVKSPDAPCFITVTGYLEAYMYSTGKKGLDFDP
jgi:hypothetical protein